MRHYANVAQNQPIDVSEEFAKQENHFFIADKIETFNLHSASGTIRWRGFSLKQRVSYHQVTPQFEDYRVWEDLPPGEYEDNQTFPFSFSFVTPRTLRLRTDVQVVTLPEEKSLMLDGDPPTEDSWKATEEGSSATYASRFGKLTITPDPLHFEFRDASGGLLTRTQHLSDSRSVVNTRPTPLCFVRSASDLHRHSAASFLLSPSEKLYGCGESFTQLDKRGQKLVLWTSDAYSSQTPICTSRCRST